MKKRVDKELQAQIDHPIEGVHLFCPDENNHKYLQGFISGPEGSVYVLRTLCIENIATSRVSFQTSLCPLYDQNISSQCQ